jgi:RNA polymerase sigma-70 factor (ECF subfamily)
VSDHLSDEALVARLCDRDTAAFTVLYDRHSRIAFGLAYRLLADPLAAEDVVQDAFLSLWRQAGSFRSQRASVRTWLLSIVHHRAIDYLRRTASREVQSAMLIEDVERPDQSIDIPRDVCVAMEAEQVRAALATLPREQQQALELQYFGGLTHREIASRLSVPVGTVKSRQRIGLLKLRTILVGAGVLPATDEQQESQHSTAAAPTGKRESRAPGRKGTGYKGAAPGLMLAAR